MSKIYEALEKVHDDPFSSGDVELSSSNVDLVVPRFHQRGIDPAFDSSVNPTDELPLSSINEDGEVVRISSGGGAKSFSAIDGQSPNKYRYTIALDDIRSVSAAIRSSAATQRTRCMGFFGFGVGGTGAALVRDVAAYEGRLDRNGVLLVDADRIRISQTEFFGLQRDSSSFDRARETGRWEMAVESNVTVGVDLVCFSEAGENFRQSTDQATYKSFVDYCRSSYDLTLFDLPADGPGSESHLIGALLDCVVILCPRQIETSVVNRYIEDLSRSGINVLGVVNTA